MNYQMLLENFSVLDSWEEKYAYLIEIGKALPPFPSDLMTDENRVHGCQSSVWMILEVKNGLLNIQATSDALIVRGLIAIIISIFSGLTVEQIKQVDIKGDFEKLGLENHLSSNRRNGFWSMVEKIKSIT